MPWLEFLCRYALSFGSNSFVLGQPETYQSEVGPLRTWITIIVCLTSINLFPCEKVLLFSGMFIWRLLSIMIYRPQRKLTWDLPSPTTDIWWSLLKTCSNLFTWGPTPPPKTVRTSSGIHRSTYGWQAGGTHPTGMHSCSVRCCRCCCLWVTLLTLVLKIGTSNFVTEKFVWFYRANVHTAKWAHVYWAYFNFINKNAFQLDAYCPLQWPSLGGVGGVCLAVGCLPVGVCVSAAGGGSARPPMDRMTDTCRNITLPQLRCGR